MTFQWVTSNKNKKNPSPLFAHLSGCVRRRLQTHPPCPFPRLALDRLGSIASANGIAWTSTFAQQMTPDFCSPGFHLGSPLRGRLSMSFPRTRESSRRERRSQRYARRNGALYVGVTNNLTRADQHLGNRLAWIPACAGMTGGVVRTARRHLSTPTGDPSRR
jgi:hypothetical protein